MQFQILGIEMQNELLILYTLEICQEFSNQQEWHNEFELLFKETQNIQTLFPISVKFWATWNGGRRPIIDLSSKFFHV
jgi:hypothetical protein